MVEFYSYTHRPTEKLTMKILRCRIERCEWMDVTHSGSLALLLKYGHREG